MASKPVYSVVTFSHSSVDDFRSPYLQTYHTSHPGVSKTRLSEPYIRHSSRRVVSHSQRSHTESTALSPSSPVSDTLTQGLVANSGSSSPPPGSTQPVSDKPDNHSATPSQHPPHALAAHKYRSLRATALPDPPDVIIPRSRSQHTTLARARSTSGSGSDVASSPLSRSSFWLAYPYQHTHSPSMCQRTASNPHMRSGSISDGSIAIPVDMKRLLSKPALPTSSPVSLQTDSDSQHSAGRRRRSARSTSRTRTRLKLPTREPSVEPSKAEESQEKQGSSLQDSPPIHTESPSPPVPPPKSVSEPIVPIAKDQKSSKPRHLVKRRPSLSKPPPPSPPSLIPPVPPLDEAAKRHSPTENSAIRAASRSPRPPDVSKLTPWRHKSKSPVTPLVSSSPSLTPAGAVAAAYMEQEARREDLALSSQAGDAGSRGRQQSVKAKREAVAPYYSVLGGSPTGRVIAVANDDWDLKLEPVRSTEERLRLTSSSSSPRTLTKKFSGKWKKAVWSPCEAGRRDSEHSTGTPRSSQPERRPSLHEVRYAAKGNDETGPFRLSLEKYAEDSLAKQAVHNNRANTWSEMAQESQKSSPRRVHSEMVSGNKMWRLMKRISGGAMREKYQQQDSPPPVPELPKHPFYLNGSGSQDGHEGGYSFGILNRFMQSRTSMSGAHPLERNLSPSPERFHTASPPTTAENGAPVTTRSSSPASSVRAFARLRRSSLHSDPGDLASSPKHIIGKHIISPSELYLLDPDNDPAPKPANSAPPPWPPPLRNLSRRTDDWISHSPEVEFASLPIPPMRHAASRQEMIITLPAIRDPSPVIPAFSNSEAINTFGSRRASPASMDRVPPRSRPALTVFTPENSSSPSTTPPPRPPRNPMRGAKPMGSDTSLVQFPLLDDAVDSVDGGGGGERVELHRRKTSSSEVHDGSAGTVGSPRTRRRSNSFEGLLSRPRRQRKMTLTFRELGDATTPTLTEKEKADRWDDLLARSARAGGTLHISGEGLVSDELHFSDVSEATFGRDGYA